MDFHEFIDKAGEDLLDEIADAHEMMDDYRRQITDGMLEGLEMYLRPLVDSVLAANLKELYETFNHLNDDPNLYDDDLAEYLTMLASTNLQADEIMSDIAEENEDKIVKGLQTLVSETIRDYKTVEFEEFDDQWDITDDGDDDVDE